MSPESLQLYVGMSMTILDTILDIFVLSPLKVYFLLLKSFKNLTVLLY